MEYIQGNSIYSVYIQFIKMNGLAIWYMNEPQKTLC